MSAIPGTRPREETQGKDSRASGRKRGLIRVSQRCGGPLARPSHKLLLNRRELFEVMFLYRQKAEMKDLQGMSNYFPSCVTIQTALMARIL
jgi:hypothetical protein